MKKILCFIESLAMGGAEKTAVRLADEWQAMGFEVHIAVVRDGVVCMPTRPNIRLYALDGTRGSYLRAITSASQLAREIQPDILVGHMPKGVLLAMIAQVAHPTARLLGMEHSVPTQHYSGLKKFLVRMLMSRGYRRADRIYAVSEGAAADMRAWGVPAEKVEALGNPIPVAQLYQSGKQGKSLRRREDVPGLAAVGRLVPVKGFDVLIRAVSLLKQGGRPVELVLLGDGPERDRLQALVKELGLEGLVSLPGQVASPEPTVMASDLLVCSSHYEGFGNVLVEAMAVGTGVVSSDCPTGPREILQDKERLAKPNDPEDLARVIEFQLNRLDAMPPKVRAELKKSLRYQAQRFDARLIATRMLAPLLKPSR